MSPSSSRVPVLVVVFCVFVTVSCKFPTLDHLKPTASDKAQGRAAAELLKRLLGTRSTEFIVSVNRSLSNDSLDVCELRSTRNNKVVATGSTGVAVASGIYNYLKYFCNCHVSWSGDQLDVPRPLPRLTGVLRINTQHRSTRSEARTHWKNWIPEHVCVYFSGFLLALATPSSSRSAHRPYIDISS
ncbi:Alpha-N-acetylglucosaminidase [Liparis tanakae]|uniref:Alpha-N-acetylglucosaminidase n=1 Tax=Liparis tanakae TaxID=230148 RepID=A0A4Z2G9G9_9TELE|nr:Alpha-N-acetylglucosaminidase [Liparis tanakae]